MTVKLSKTRQFIIDEFINCLKEDRIPWEKGWTSLSMMNAVSNHQYSGLNCLILKYMSQVRGYNDPRWLTFKQVADKGWKLKDAKRKGIPIEFWSPWDVQRKEKITMKEAEMLLKEDEDRVKFVCNCYYVFNAELVEGIEKFEYGKKLKTDIKHQIAEECINKFLENEKIKLTHFGEEAFYAPSEDRINIPLKEKFKSIDYYLSTLAHEVCHSTGHTNRLNRDMSGKFGSHDYAQEELKAEIGSALLNSELGIEINQEMMNNHKAYIQSWISIIEDKPNELFKAIYSAEKIAEYITEKGDLEKVRESFSDFVEFFELYENEPEIMVEESLSL